MSQVKGQVIRQRQDRKCPWAAILITKISVADNRLGISSQCFNQPQQVRSAFPVQLYISQCIEYGTRIRRSCTIQVSAYNVMFSTCE